MNILKSIISLETVIDLWNETGRISYLIEIPPNVEILSGVEGIWNWKECRLLNIM